MFYFSNIKLRTCTHWLLESVTRMSPLYVTPIPWGFMNSPWPRPLPPTTWRRSVSPPAQELQEWELSGLRPGVDLLLLTATTAPLLVLERGSDEDWDLQNMSGNCHSKSEVPQASLCWSVGKTSYDEGTISNVSLVNPHPHLVPSFLGKGVEDVVLPTGHRDDLLLYEPGQGLRLEVEERLDVTGDLGQAGPWCQHSLAVPGSDGHQSLLEDCRLPTALAI